MGSPLNDIDLFYYTFGGLGPKYVSFITTISLQTDDISFENLCTIFCNQELRLSSLHNDVSPPIAMAATKSSTPILGNPSFPKSPTSFSSSNRGRGHGRGRGSPFNHNTTHFDSGRPLCQVCKKYGHKALDCYNRLNMAFQGRNPSCQLGLSTSSLILPQVNGFLILGPQIM